MRIAASFVLHPQDTFSTFRSIRKGLASTFTENNGGTGGL